MNVLTVGDEALGQVLALLAENVSTPLRVRAEMAGSNPADPLTASYWVDTNSTVSPATGGITAPFVSLQDAYDAAVTAGLTQVNILAVALDPSESLAIDTVATAVVGMTAGLIGFAGVIGPLLFSDASITGAAPLALQGLQVTEVSASGGNVIFLDACLLINDLVCPGCVIGLSRTVCTGSGTFEADNVTAFDPLSLGTVFQNYGTVTIGEYSTPGIGVAPSLGNVLPNANVGRNFVDPSWYSLPFARATAPRTYTLNSTPNGNLRSGMVDVYEQTQVISFLDQTSAAVVAVWNPGDDPARYMFFHDPNTNVWSVQQKWKLG